MNKVIIITGAANGVGKAVATILKDNDLILIDEDKDNLVALSNSLNANYYVCDLSDDTQIKNMVSIFAGYHILVNMQDFLYLCPLAFSTLRILCCTMRLMASLAGPRYFLGSNSAGEFISV